MIHRYTVIASHVLSSVALMTLAACGGGGGGDPVSASTGPSAEGVYGGNLTGGSSSAFQLLILENGDFWAMYGVQTATSFGVAGFIQGTGQSNNGSFTSSNTKDFGHVPAISGNTSATYNATAKTISGTVSSTAGTVTFSGGPIAGSLYNYATAANISQIAGSWTTTSLTGEGVALSISSTGTFSAVSSLGCQFSGNVGPRASGKNVFDVSFTFGAAPCALAGQSATGIAVVYPLANGKNQLIVAAVDTTRTYGSAAFGVR